MFCWHNVKAGVWIALAILTVAGVHLAGGQLDLGALQRPLLATSVHLDGHDLAGAQRGQKQAIGIGAGIISISNRLVGEEAMRCRPSAQPGSRLNFAR